MASKSEGRTFFRPVIVTFVSICVCTLIYLSFLACMIHTIRIICIGPALAMLVLLESKKPMDKWLLYGLASYSLLGPVWLWVTPLVALQTR